MSQWTTMILALAGGGALGTIFFAGLWWTISQIGRARRPGILLTGSFLLRMGLALGGFYLAARSGWRPLLASLLGFMLARVFVARWCQAPVASAPQKGSRP